MKISVLLSLYQREIPLYFDLAMQSIWQNQERKPDEIVLVEDGSITSDLKKVEDKWKKIIGSQLIVVSLEQNQGLAAALNKGISYCRGDYIARMDTDDISLPNRFKLQEDYLLEHPEIAVLGGAMIEFNNEKELSPRFMPIGMDKIKKAICKTSPFVHPTVFLRKDLFENGFFFNEQCRRCQDLELWFRIMAAGYRMENLPNIILKYRKDETLYKKRKKSAITEFKIYMKGIKLIYGLLSWRYIYPILHLLWRLMPSKGAVFMYEKFILKYWQKQ